MRRSNGNRVPAAVGALLLAACVAVAGCGPPPEVLPEGRDLLAHGIDVDGGWSRMDEVPAPALILEPEGRASQLLELPGTCELILRGEATHPGLLRIISFEVDASNGARVGLVDAERVAVEDGRLAVGVELGRDEPTLVELEYSWKSEQGTLRIERAVLVEPAPPRPPVVFISLDTFAARHTSLHGYARETTPHLDAFAATGTVFDYCLANAAWTTPSYISQFTGLHPLALRSRRAVDSGPLPDGGLSWNDWFLADARWTLAEMLRGAGYRTAAFVDNPMIGRAHGINQGFERYDTEAVESSQNDPEGGIRTVGPLALDWVDTLGPDQPFFLFVQANDTHGPYLPPPPFAGRFADVELPAEPAEAPVAKIRSIFGKIPSYIAEASVAPAPRPERLATAPLVQAYDEEVLMLDDGIGKLLDGLDERGLLDDAVVIVSADHGESMLEHMLYFGHTTPYDEVLHVPLVIRLPDGRGAGRRVARTVQLVDLYPTLAELLGIPVREHLHGRSLLPLVDGETLPPRPVLATEALMHGMALEMDGWKLVQHEPLLVEVEQTFLSSPHARRWVQQWLSEQAPDLPSDVPVLDLMDFLATNRPELATSMRTEMRQDLRGAFHELYHVREDPLELQDLAAEQPDRLAQMLELLAAERQRSNAARLDVAPPPAFQLSQEELAELRELGYVGGH
ncbi:MAG: sulfatase [Planctomycetota bacterium]|jgi:arylsulfatase